MASQRVGKRANDCKQLLKSRAKPPVSWPMASPGGGGQRLSASSLIELGAAKAELTRLQSTRQPKMDVEDMKGRRGANAPTCRSGGDYCAHPPGAGQVNLIVIRCLRKKALPARVQLVPRAAAGLNPRNLPPDGVPVGSQTRNRIDR
jgi:hypothetical protein